MQGHASHNLKSAGSRAQLGGEYVAVQLMPTVDLLQPRRLVPATHHAQKANP